MSQQRSRDSYRLRSVIRRMCFCKADALFDSIDTEFDPFRIRGGFWSDMPLWTARVYNTAPIRSIRWLEETESVVRDAIRFAIQQVRA